MGHLIFLVLHALALLFLLSGLLITVPLHLIYGALRSRGETPTPPAPSVTAASADPQWLRSVRKGSSAGPLIGPDGSAPKLRGDGRFAVDVVGESFYGDNLAALFPIRPGEDREVKVLATLRLQDDNPHDDQAVAVWVADRQVGHLSRVRAREFRAAARRGGLQGYREFTVDALVYVPDSADQHHSVALDLPDER